MWHGSAHAPVLPGARRRKDGSTHPSSRPSSRRCHRPSGRGPLRRPTGHRLLWRVPIARFVLICSSALLSTIHVTHTNVPAMVTPDTPVLAFTFVASLFGECPSNGYTSFSNSN